MRRFKEGIGQLRTPARRQEEIRQMLSIKKAVVTGATGAIGMALIEELTQNGIQVTAICHPGSPRNRRIPTGSMVRTVEGDLSRLSQLADAFDGEQDAFFHLAWAGTYGEDRNRMELQLQNIEGTINAVRLCGALRCKVFVGVGSQSEFGHVEGKLNGELSCFPDTGYGAAKLSAGTLSRVLCRQMGIRHVWARVLSVYGPNDSARTMVMGTVERLLHGERPQFTKGDQIWDFLFNADAALALRLLAEKGLDGKVYCLGSGQAKKLRDYILEIRDAVDPQQEIGLGELAYYPNQVMHLEADISSLTADTGFVPQWPFSRGIQATVDWVKKQKPEP